ncbi:MAG: anaerobic ribonucleoside-triphosphate reductase activating protein [Oscillospiraceae bacterium]|nr:anaerobic ribonucleoside-triphosphate reductase activating protein [Oscillospiraceae bacterium]
MSKPIRLAGIVRESIVDGPGIRFTIFVQGCPHHCEGCHNPETHDFSGGYNCEPEKILAEIKKNPLLDGVTLSGGEPLCQAAALLPLAQEIKRLGLNLFIYTGSIFESLLKEADPDTMALLREGDYLVDGPFVLAQRDLTLLFRGSQNQRILDLPASLAQGKAVLSSIGQ